MLFSLHYAAQIYDTASGDQLAVIYFLTPIHSLAMDSLGYFLFAGGQNGIIYETRLHEKEGTSGELSSRKSKDALPVFIGHK